MGEAFLSAFLQVLFDRLASGEFIELLRGRNLDEVLEKLKITLLTITAVLNDAEEKQFSSPAVEKWKVNLGPARIGYAAGASFPTL